jgi:response regulator of citrate/malate metabolism
MMKNDQHPLAALLGPAEEELEKAEQELNRRVARVETVRAEAKAMIQDAVEERDEQDAIVRRVRSMITQLKGERVSPPIKDKGRRTSPASRATVLRTLSNFNGPATAEEVATKAGVSVDTARKSLEYLRSNPENGVGVRYAGKRTGGNGTPPRLYALMEE